MVVNEDAYWLSKYGVLESIASKPAPTEAQIAQVNNRGLEKGAARVIGQRLFYGVDVCSCRVTRRDTGTPLNTSV